ncbi:MAG TPA: hypothetical protein VM347_11500 [Nonomuraea sp.]|nr:hypothetical protein [Nonomuraea sp.]
MKALPVAVAVGIVLSGVLVWQTSNWAFSPADIVRAGSASISSEAAGQAMSPESGAVARATEPRCVRPPVTGPASTRTTVVVSSEGSVPTDISRYILLTVETGVQGTAAADCDGFTAHRVT